jgi:hypothetical protein
MRHPLTNTLQATLATGQMNQLLTRLQSGFLIPRPLRDPYACGTTSLGDEFEYREYSSKLIRDALILTSTDVIACAAINRICAGMGTLKLQFKQPSSVLRAIFPDAVLDRVAKEQSRIHADAYRQLVTLGFIAFRVVRDVEVNANGEDVGSGQSRGEAGPRTFFIPTVQIVDPLEVVFAKQTHSQTRVSKMVARQRSGAILGVASNDAVDESVFFYVKDMPSENLISPAFQALRAQRAEQANDRARQHAQAVMSNPPIAIRYKPSAAAVRDGVYAATVSEGVTQIQDEKVADAMVSAVTTCHAIAATMQAYVFEPEMALGDVDVIDSEPGGIGAPLSVSNPTDTTKRLVILPQNTEVVPVPIATIAPDALADKELQMKLVATAFKYPYQMLMSADANPHSSALLENQVDRATDEARRDMCAFSEMVTSLTICADLREFGNGTRKIGTRLLSKTMRGVQKNRARRLGGVVMQPTVEYITSESLAADAVKNAAKMRRQAAAFSSSDDSSSSSDSDSDSDKADEATKRHARRKHLSAKQLWAAAEDVSDDDIGEKEQEKMARARQMLALAGGTRSTEIVARFEGGMGMRQENTLAAYQQFFIPWETARKSLAEHLHLPEAALSKEDPREIQRKFELAVMKDGMRVKEGLLQQALAAAVVAPQPSAAATTTTDEPPSSEKEEVEADAGSGSDPAPANARVKVKDKDTVKDKDKDKGKHVPTGKLKKASSGGKKRTAVVDSESDDDNDKNAPQKKSSVRRDGPNKKQKAVRASAEEAEALDVCPENDASVTVGDDSSGGGEIPDKQLDGGVPPVAASPNASAVC